MEFGLEDVNVLVESTPLRTMDTVMNKNKRQIFILFLKFILKVFILIFY